MSLFVTNGTEIPTTFDFPEAFEDAVPPPQIQILRSEQNTDACCYAACAEMVIHYCLHPHFVDQCRIASLVKAVVCCPPGNRKCTDSGCQKDQVKMIFQEFGVLSQEMTHPISLQQVRHEVTAHPGRIIELVIDWDPVGEQQSSHAVLLAGIISDFVYVIDPLPEGPYNGWQTYDSVLSGFGNGLWVMTWLGLTKG
jgi:hypothetical protein